LSSFNRYDSTIQLEAVHPFGFVCASFENIQKQGESGGKTVRKREPEKPKRVYVLFLPAKMEWLPLPTVSSL
jgi:hypothetical protein